MPDVRRLNPSPPHILSSVDEALKGGHPVMVLFDDGRDTVHDRFIDEFVHARGSGDYVVVWRGDAIASKEEFYDECIRVMPACASYFGRNLDALSEVLRSGGIGLAPDPKDRTLWLWRNANGLFLHEPEFFRKLYAGTVSDAKHVNRRQGLGGIGGVPFPPHRVSFVMTGQWEAMKEAAQDGDSFLHVTRWWQYRPQPPPEPTELMVLRVTE